MSQQQRSAIVIQRFWRKRRPRNDTCAITQEALVPPIFRYYPDPNCRPIGYSLVQILELVQITGKTTDPMTREKYTSTDLDRMDHLMTVYKLHDTYLSPKRAIEKKLQGLEAGVRVAYDSLLNPTQDMLVEVPLGSLVNYLLANVMAAIRALAQVDKQRALRMVATLASNFSDGPQFARYADFTISVLPLLVEDFFESMQIIVAE